MKNIALLIGILVLLNTNKDHKISTKNDLKLETENIHYEAEVHLKNIKQLTFGGDNAEAYFSFNNSQLVFQSNNKDWGVNCDQIFIRDINKPFMNDEKPSPVSTGFGRTTCSYFLPGDTNIIYASTHLADSLCPKEPERRKDGKKKIEIWEYWTD